MEYEFFWGSDINKSDNFYFSQWHKINFIENGINFNCCEQYMMYHKALLFNDSEIKEKILKSTNPKEQKALGRSVKGFNYEVWEKKATEVIYRGNYLKFSKEPLLTLLLNTRGKILVEASPFDIIYGVGIRKDNPAINNYKNWNGKNKLGFILTDLRIELQSENNLPKETDYFLNEYNQIKDYILGNH